jgi:hypothetical protein
MNNYLGQNIIEKSDFKGEIIPLSDFCNKIWPMNLDLAIEMTEHDLLVGKHHIRSNNMDKVSPFGMLYDEYSKLLSMGENERES